MHESIKAGGIGAQNMNGATMGAILVRQETLAELAVFKRLHLQIKCPCDKCLHKQTEHPPLSNQDSLIVNVSLPTDTNASRAQKSEHNNGLKYF